MTRPAEFKIVEITDDHLIVADVGHAYGCLTVTNDVNRVVSSLHHKTGFLPNDRRLFYYDSEGDLCEVLHTDGRFIGWRPGGPEGFRAVGEGPGHD